MNQQSMMEMSPFKKDKKKDNDLWKRGNKKRPKRRDSDSNGKKKKKRDSFHRSEPNDDEA